MRAADFKSAASADFAIRALPCSLFNLLLFMYLNQALVAASKAAQCGSARFHKGLCGPFGHSRKSHSTQFSTTYSVHSESVSQPPDTRKLQEHNSSPLDERTPCQFYRSSRALNRFSTTFKGAASALNGTFRVLARLGIQSARCVEQVETSKSTASATSCAEQKRSHTRMGMLG